MSRLYRYSIRHPRRVVAAAVLITLAIAPGSMRLQLRTDGHALVPTNAPEVLYDRSIRDEFQTEDQIVVLICSDHPEGVFNPHTIELIEELTNRFCQVEDVREVDLFSLATERSDRLKPGTLRIRRFFDPLPSTQQELDQLRDDLREIELYTGTLISYDGQATSIFVGVPPGTDRVQLHRTLQDIVASLGPIPDEIHVIGAPVAEALLGTHILEDLGVPRALLGERVAGSGDADAWRMPRSLHEFRVFIARHVGLVPIAIAVMMVVFLISFRSFTAAMLPLMEVGACLVIVFGLMGWFGVPIYLTIAVLPVILTAIGVADEIHIFSRYAQLLRDRPTDDYLAVLRTTMSEMSAPVVKTSVTTAVGFCSFALSPLGPVRAFGVFTSVGIIVCMLWSLTVVPALLAMVSPRRFVRPPPTGRPQGHRPFFARLGPAVIRRRYAVLGLVLVVVLAAPLGIARVVVQDSWIDGFAPDSEFYQTTQFFNDQFLGTHVLLVCVDTGHYSLAGEVTAEALEHHAVRLPADLVSEPETLLGNQLLLRRIGPSKRARRGGRRPEVASEWRARIESVVRDGEHIVATLPRRRGSPAIALDTPARGRIAFEITPRRLTLPDVVCRIGRLEEFIEARRQDAVGGVIGTAKYVATSHFMASGRREGNRRIPDEPRWVEQAWGRHRLARGQERLRQAVDADYARSLITVFLENANFVATGRLMKEIRDYERTHLHPHGITLGFAGDVAVSQTVIDAIVETQVLSLLLSLAGIIAVTAVLGRSFVWGLYCVLPCALAVLANFAVMGWIGMPLGVATSMFAGMTLGIGVDYAIHLLERYRMVRRQGGETDAALAEAVTTTGPAVLVDALAVALGFGILTLSQVPANARLGGLVVLSIVGCLAATLLVLPALLRAVARRSS